MKLTDLLDQIDRLDQDLDVTPGPWFIVSEKESHPRVWGAHEDDEARMVTQPTTSLGNAEFIALARTALPTLAKALRVVMKECQEAQDRFDRTPDDQDREGQSRLAEIIENAITDAIEVAE